MSVDEFIMKLFFIKIVFVSEDNQSPDIGAQ